MKKNNEKARIVIFLYYFVILWYFSFSASIVLRPYVGIFWPAVAVAGIFLYYKDVKSYLVTKYDFFALLSITAILVSVFYSYDQTVSLRYLMLLVLYFIIAHIIILKIENYDVFINLVFWFSVFMCFVTLIQVFRADLYMRYFLPLLPAKYQEHTLYFMNNGAYVGFTNQTSGNAFSLSIGIGALCYRILKDSTVKMNYIMMVLLLFALFFTQRRASTIEVLLLLSLFLFRFKKSKLSSIFMILLVAICILYIGIDNIPGLSGIAEKFAVYSGDLFNGRMQLWGETIEAFYQRPLTGHGMDTFTTYFMDAAKAHTISSAHNSFLQILFELGVIGTIFYFLPFVYAFIRTIHAFINRPLYEEADFRILSFSFFIQFYCFGNSIVEGLFSSEQSVFLLFIVQLMAVRIMNKYNNPIAGRQSDGG